MYYARCENLTHFTRAIGPNCFDSCAEKADMPFMSVKEGLCFRNCITKFSSWFPTLRGNVENAGASYYHKKVSDLVDTPDPYSKQSDALMGKLLQR